MSSARVCRRAVRQSRGLSLSCASAQAGSPGQKKQCCGEHSRFRPVAGPSRAGEVRLYTEGDVLYEDMLASIAAARRSIRLESYIFAADEIGWRFASALAARVADGVRVWVHIDAAGSFFWASRALERYLKKSGVHIRWFHRWSWRRPWRYNRRNHRKLLIVDAQHFYLGGFNIHRESSRACYGEARWRDTQVRVAGPLAGDAAELFDRFWRGKRHWDPKPAAGDGLLVPNHTRRCRNVIRCLLARRIDEAKRYVHLTTPYFVPDLATQQAMIAAARRGVDVRLLVPSKSDVPITQWAARAAYANLLAAGVRVYEYQPRILHAKTVVVDGEWSTVGTANLDYRSLFTNYELNYVSHEPDFCAELERQFRDDLAQSGEVTAKRWALRPWSAKLTEGVGWLARRLL